MRVAWFLVVAVLTVVACGPDAMPRPSPNEFPEVVSGLVRRGATITTQVAGDAGCPQETLNDNAVRLDVAMPGSPATAVYLFRWRRAPDFEAEASAYAACLTDVRARNAGVELSSFERSPWRAYGVGWSSTLRSAVDEAITSP